MKILVCGGRNYGEKNHQEMEAFVEAMARVCDKHGPEITWINGGCRTGADKLLRAMALGAEMDCITYPARWKRQGQAAGPIRNQRMIDELKPDAAVALPGGAGTADMVRRLRAAGIPVWIPYGGVSE